MTTLTVGLLQMTSGLTPDDNWPALEAGLRDLAGRGATLLLTPEMTGALDRDRRRLLTHVHTESEDSTLARISDLARGLGVWVLIGSLALRARADSDRLVNRQLLVNPAGDVSARYDKLHLFDVDLSDGESYRESASYDAGCRPCVADMPWGRLGLSICYDIRFPQLYRLLAHAGADVLVAPSAFTAVTGAAHWHVLLRARAIETGCFVLAPAQCGSHADGRATYGHSLVVSPWGEIVADGGESPCGLIATLDLDDVARTRARIPSLRHDRPLEAPAGAAMG